MRIRIRAENVRVGVTVGIRVAIVVVAEVVVTQRFESIRVIWIVRVVIGIVVCVRVGVRSLIGVS